MVLSKICRQAQTSSNLEIHIPREEHPLLDHVEPSQTTTISNRSGSKILDIASMRRRTVNSRLTRDHTTILGKFRRQAAIHDSNFLPIAILVKI
jgi:hypothetical protein